MHSREILHQIAVRVEKTDARNRSLRQSFLPTRLAQQIIRCKDGRGFVVFVREQREGAHSITLTRITVQVLFFFSHENYCVPSPQREGGPFLCFEANEKSFCCTRDVARAATLERRRGTRQPSVLLLLRQAFHVSAACFFRDGTGTPALFTCEVKSERVFWEAEDPCGLLAVGCYECGGSSVIVLLPQGP